MDDFTQSGSDGREQPKGCNVLEFPAEASRERRLQVALERVESALLRGLEARRRLRGLSGGSHGGA